jgi:bifunctional pyridoxal-dependent enzyme with beta-cystathionase and maltose regulon repressor activities
MYNEDILNTATIEGMLAAEGEKWHRDPPDVIPMWLADPDFPTAPFIKKALINAVQDEDFLYNAPSNLRTREVMAEKLARRNGLKLSRDQLFITQGVNPCMWLAIQYAAKPGDEIVVTDPMYDPFYTAVNVSNTKPVYWKLYEKEGYRFDIERLKNLVTKKTKLIFVCNPHNPSGRVLTKEELKAIADVAIDNKINVMVDELWEDILFDNRQHISLATLSPEISDLTITAWGISKTWGLPGLQVGYIGSSNKQIMDSITKLAKGIMRGTSTLSLVAARSALDRHSEYWIRDIIKHLHKIREIGTKRFTEMGCTVPELQGTYLLFPRFNVKMTHDELYKLILEKAKVSLQNGTVFGPEGAMHLRMTIATSEAILNEALDRIERALKTIK